MDIKEVLEREKNVVLHGQTAKFRLVKYAVILVLGLGIYFWKGAEVLLHILAIAIVASLFIHFFFRYMSDSWRKSWWLYKKKE